MLLKSLNSKQREALDSYLEENGIELYDGIENDIYNEEEVTQCVTDILTEERDYFIEELKRSKISGEYFIYLNIKTEENFIKYCMENHVFSDYIDSFFDEICDNVYYIHK